MEKFAFYKYSGHGNDFVIIDNWNNEVPEKDFGKIAKLMCRQKFGVGADGVVFITAGPDEVDFAWRFFNVDGTEADICGNAARCTAHLAVALGIAPDEMSFKTKAGIVEATVNERLVKIHLPKIGRAEGAALVEAEGVSLTYHRLNTGVPHAVAWVEDADSLNVAKIGRAVRRHPAFAPEGSNINFVKILGPNRLALRSYERGVEDEILASGTGAAAAVLLAAAQDLITATSVICQTKGGEELTVSFEGPADNPEKVFLEGKVRCLFSGQVEPDLFLK
ncbi:MAG: diaminopimelate epimerase [Candidatus Adiutrix sp.]|jgi:diaminopimelate epimerase|nr:diaminopimelate epimerase [Candidatus Adiutrix sp.]